MKTSPAGLLFLAKWEGEVDHAYYDVAHILTVGIGHVIKPGDTVDGAVIGDHVGDPITHQEALDLLAHDVAWAEDAVNHLVTIPLNQNQFDALVDLTFNIGAGAFAKSALLAQINAGNVIAAAAHFTDYDHAVEGGKFVEDQGLKRRRITEQNLFLTPDAAPSGPAPTLPMFPPMG